MFLHPIELLNDCWWNETKIAYLGKWTSTWNPIGTGARRHVSKFVSKFLWTKSLKKYTEAVSQSFAQGSSQSGCGYSMYPPKSHMRLMTQHFHSLCYATRSPALSPIPFNQIMKYLFEPYHKTEKGTHALKSSSSTCKIRSLCRCSLGFFFQSLS